MTGDDVQALVARAQGGDGGAFGELYERFAPEIRRYLLRQVHGQGEAAEDLTEEVFVKALQHVGSYQARGLPFAAWLYRIARNHLIDHLRSSRRRTMAALDAVPDIPAADAEHALARVLDRHELADALARLSEDQRQAVSLRFLGGRSTAETATLMGKTENAVKKLQARGLARLRRCIEDARRISVWRHLVATLTYDSRLQPRVVGTRAVGAVAGRHRRLMYEAGDVEIDLEVRPGRATGRLLVLGQVTAGGPNLVHAWVSAEGPSGRLLAEVDEDGQFALDGLVPGTHRVAVGLNDELIELPPLGL